MDPSFGDVEMAKFFADHDEDCDVLYIGLGQPTPDALSYEDEDGLIWRQSKTGKWVGVTILDFKHRWTGREAELMRRIAERLPAAIQGQMLEHA
jgi:hypothetical protein